MVLTDLDGNPLPDAIQRRARKESKSEIQAWLAEGCEYWNQGIDHILNLHLQTPAPRPAAAFQSEPFSHAQPPWPVPKRLSLLDRLLPGRRRRVEATNRDAKARFAEAQEEWERLRDAHLAEQAQVQARHEAAQRGDRLAAEDLLQASLEALEWPRETVIAFELDDNILHVDVDLPEVEDMPTQEAQVAKRGLSIRVKDKSATQVRREYMRHIHSILFRLVGEAFHQVPWLSTVVASAYSQRPDPATGRERNEYLISCAVPAERWNELNFQRLDSIELPTCLGAFPIRRKMTKTGVFKAVDPFSLEEGRNITRH